MKVDYQSFKLLPAAVAGLEVKYIVAVAATHKSKSEQAQSQQFAQQQQQQKEACPTQVC